MSQKFRLLKVYVCILAAVLVIALWLYRKSTRKPTVLTVG